MSFHVFSIHEGFWSWNNLGDAGVRSRLSVKVKGAIGCPGPGRLWFSIDQGIYTALSGRKLRRLRYSRARSPNMLGGHESVVHGSRDRMNTCIVIEKNSSRSVVRGIHMRRIASGTRLVYQENRGSSCYETLVRRCSYCRCKWLEDGVIATQADFFGHSP